MIMNKKILFLPMNASSHYYASFGLARTLSKLGFDIIYGGESRFGHIVDENGFYFLKMRTNVLADNDKWSLKMFVKNWRSFVGNRPRQPYSEVYLEFCRYQNHLEKILHTIKPDYVFLDVCLSRHIVLLKKNRISTIMLQLMLPTRRYQNVPPHNYFLTSRKQLNFININAAWIRQYCRNVIDALLKTFIYLKSSPKYLLIRWGREEGLRLAKIITFRKSGVYDYIHDTHELSLTPDEFDFPWKKKSQYIHSIGPFINFSRTVTNASCDMKKLKKIINNDRFRKVVLCSFGTLPALRGKSNKAIRKVINVFKNKPEVVLIISTGNSTLSHETDIPDNIFVFDNVPQVQLLAHCDLMIGHGGLNSVFECIMQGVPMFLITMISAWDHPGISARVVYHKLGLTTDYKKCSEQKISKNVDELLTDTLYRDNVSLLRATLVKKDLSKEVKKFMEYLSESSEVKKEQRDGKLQPLFSTYS